MRILCLAHSFWPDANGVSNVATNLAKQLKSRGHEVIIGSGAEDPAAATLLPPPFTIKRFTCSGNGVVGLRGDIAKYKMFVASVAPEVDVVVVHCAQSWCVDALLDDDSLSRVPVVLVSHGLSCFSRPEYSNYFHRLAGWLHGKKVIALSAKLEEVDFCRKFGLPPPEIIGNGVDLDEWGGPLNNVRDAWSIGDSPWIVNVSNHSTVKNHSAFWRLAKSVRRELPQLCATIIGDSYPAGRGGLGRVGVKGGCWYACRCKKLFSSSVDLRTRVPRSLVTSAIRTADLLAVTSYREAAPIVLLEAMAASVPWVAVNVGSISEYAGGIVVSSDAEMHTAVVSLMKDGSERRRLGHQGREVIEASRSWAKIACAHEAVYTAHIAAAKRT